MQLDLEPSDINVVMQALEQGQFRVVAPVLMKIQAQVMAQQVKPENPVEPAPIGDTD